MKSDEILAEWFAGIFTCNECPAEHYCGDDGKCAGALVKWARKEARKKEKESESLHRPADECKLYEQQEK